MDQVIQENFQIDTLIQEDQGLYKRNQAKYASILNNFQDFMLTLDRKGASQAIKLKQE